MPRLAWMAARDSSVFGTKPTAGLAAMVSARCFSAYVE
jgi:hypothetical protein